VNPIIETWHIVVRELRKNFRSVKGIVLLTLSVLGGCGLALIQIFIDKETKQIASGAFEMIDQAQREQSLEKILEWWFRDKVLASYLSHSPSALALITIITFNFIPLLIAIIGFDGISGEVQHRSVRYWVVRSRKASYYLGKVIGLWFTAVAMTLIMHAIVWIVLVVGGVDKSSSVLFWGLRYWITVVPTVAAWTGLGVLIASQFRTPLVSLLSVCATFFVMFIADKIGSAYVFRDFVAAATDGKTIAPQNWVDYFYPSSYDGFLLHPSPAKWGIGLGLSMAFLVVTSLAGMTIFQKRDV
jgi:ABC-type transport system involved in multi-copper enzyme maturation permease subunit